jgi:hypothetical protein
LVVLWADVLRRAVIGALIVVCAGWLAAAQGVANISCGGGAARDDDCMSDAIPSLVAGPGFPRMALGLAWLGSCLGTSVSGWFAGGLPGQLLAGAAVLGVVAAGAVASNRHRRVTLAFSAAASTVVITAGAVAAALMAITGGPEVAAAAATGAVPVLGGLITWRLSHRARRMAG